MAEMIGIDMGAGTQMVLVFFLLLFLKVPVAFALGLSSIYAMWELGFGLDLVGDLIGHLLQEHIAGIRTECAAGDDRAEEDLEVDLMIRHVDAARVVDGIRVDTSAPLRKLHPGCLCQTQVSALCHDAGAEFLGIADRNPARCRVLDALLPEEELASAAIAALDAFQAARGGHV